MHLLGLLATNYGATCLRCEQISQSCGFPPKAVEGRFALTAVAQSSTPAADWTSGHEVENGDPPRADRAYRPTASSTEVAARSGELHTLEQDGVRCRTYEIKTALIQYRALSYSSETVDRKLPARSRMQHSRTSQSSNIDGHHLICTQV